MNDCFKFYVKTRVVLGENASKIHGDLQTVYGNECPSRATIFRYASTKPSLPSTANPVGRPVTISTHEKIKEISDLISANRHFSLREIEEWTGVNHELVRRILHEELKRRYVCSSWVPHSLDDRQKELRKTAAMAMKTEKLLDHCQLVIDNGGSYVIPV
jgi:hypothetical protein